jgi:hypothetical protein
VHGVLNLIDLAGSERLSRSGATGDRLKETQVQTIGFCFLNFVAIRHILCNAVAVLIPNASIAPIFWKSSL